MNRRGISWVSMVLCGWLVTSCNSGKTNLKSESGDKNVGNGHWVHDERLRTLMAELDRAARTDWPQELEGEVNLIGPSRDTCLTEAADHAMALAGAAKRMSETTRGLQLAEVDRRSFDAQIATLHDQAQRLEQSARTGDIHNMQTVLAEIQATCQSCHTRFRDVSGPLVPD